MPATSPHDFLTPMDASFLYFESSRQALHIGSCMIYEGDIAREEMMALLEERIHLAPRYRQRVLFPPMSVSHPIWVDDPEFDIGRHVEELWLEESLDERSFAEAVALAYQGMLERDRPLWHAVLLRGLPQGNTAVVWKVHHAMIDGVSGIDLTMALNDLKADAPAPTPPAEPWQPEPIPSAFDHFQESFEHRIEQVTRLWTDSAFSLFRPAQLTARARKIGRAVGATWPTALRPAPSTRFNGRVSGELGWTFAELSFTEMRDIRSALGGTVNDVVLTVLSGALGRYLRYHGDSTDGVELRALCPVSMRQPDERGQLGNLVSFMVAPLFVGIEDSVERLETERKAMESLKVAGQAEGIYELNRWSDSIPPGWMEFAGALATPNPILNTVSTNVPGPQIPLYQGGRRLLAWYPLGVVAADLGIFVSILTYDQRVTFGATVDAHLVPDAWRLGEFLHESFAELREAAGVEEVPFDRVPLSD